MGQYQNHNDLLGKQVNGRAEMSGVLLGILNGLKEVEAFIPDTAPEPYSCLNISSSDLESQLVGSSLIRDMPITKILKKVNPGAYYHFGIENGIICLFLDSISNEEIKLVVGIDELPISKSSSTQFWPILAYIRSTSNHVFPIGVYCGTQKPNDRNDYLKDFVIEAEQFILNGIFINGKFYKVVLDVVCCDVPAKSFVLKIKGINGFYSCTRCKIEGEYIENRLRYPYSEPSERTHNDYVQRAQISHHVFSNNSCLVEISRFDIVKGFSLDNMHLVCLGVVKKLLML
ncbi:uncharacterized protein LOC132934885 [Metopolophium dirhodum]|uniref:uncharacterized protein LOC132934885 n=1 Tax=Metopolophium dirhodum TaxID=44670 RepID=UPI00298FDE08|nr:uncharacterized protein LOC132934885 [Metopolophium dirhodum]